MRAPSIRITSAVIAGLLILSASAGMAQAQDQQRGKWGKDRGEKWAAVMKELNLTPEQQQLIAQQRARENEQSQELRRQMQQVKDELARELDKENPDKAKAYALAGQMKELMGKRIEQRVDRILSLREILTPEQFKKLNEKTGQFKEKRGGRHEESRYRDCRIKPDRWS